MQQIAPYVSAGSRAPISVYSALGVMGGFAHRVAATSAAWPAANRAIFMPFRLARPKLIRKMAVMNGTAVSGNIDVGIYDRVGTRIVSAGSTAQAGTSVLQEFDIADTLLGVGLFYLAVALDNGTGTTFRIVSTAALWQSRGVFQMASAFPLPATAVFATPAATYIPVCGAAARTVV